MGRQISAKPRPTQSGFFDRARIASRPPFCDFIAMTFRDWQQLSPPEAAREVHRRVRTRLSPAQQRAVMALLPGEPELEATFAAADRRGALGGVPYFLKDVFDVAGLPTFAGSTFLPEVRPTPTRDGAIVSALRDAGAAFAGKTHLHEFAYGITGENPHYGDCTHPHFPDRTSGGSSSGSAAAVAAGLVPVAIGSDTGGSIRVPAAFCGLFGFRLTPRAPSIGDAFPLAPSFDTAGWFTAHAADMRAMLAALAGPREPARHPRGCYLAWPEAAPDVAIACRAAAEPLAPPADDATREALLAGFQSGAEIYATLSASEAWEVHAAWADRFRDHYDPVVWARLHRALRITPEARDRARLGLAAVRRVWAQFFQTFDFLVLPATPFEALAKADCTPENRHRLLALAAPASLGGLPVLTVPVALPSGLTAGLQIIVPRSQSPAVDWVLDRFVTS
jgi:amidase/aspartyl-tRNA(Asn)/glutamyl-tRNA(Gln) amidotransferase subunit A